MSSNIDEVSDNPYYRRIVSLGSRVIPVILRDLNEVDDTELWHEAMSELTGLRIKHISFIQRFASILVGLDARMGMYFSF